MTTQNDSDSIWSKSIKEDSYLFLEELFDKYGRQLFAYLLARTKSPEAAEEILYIVFIRAWQQIHSLQDEQALKHYIHKESSKEIIRLLKQLA